MGVFLWFYGYFTAFMFGLKRAGDEAFGQVDNGTGTEIGSVKDMDAHRISLDLLRAEETQQVEELRYRTYKVDREAKHYDYYSPLKAIKIKDLTKASKHVEYEKSDGLKLITIQENFPVTEGIEEGLEQYESGKPGKATEYWIKIRRDFLPRFALEKFTTKLVVKEFDEEHVILDFYVHKYPKQFDTVSRPFIREVREIIEKGIRSDVVRFGGVSFTTLHAYGFHDMILFDFDHAVFKEALEYDGHYILRFKAKVRIKGQDLQDQYYSKTMAEKYENKEKKEVTIDFTGKPPVREYVCEKCGKTVTFDTDAIDNMPLMFPRDITDEDDKGTQTSALAYYDAEIAYQTFGKWLCADCIRKEHTKLTKQLAKDIDRKNGKK